MLFNSLDFAIFLPIVFILYWFGTNRNLKIQNLLLLISSYIFYGWWDWRFLFLMFFSSAVDYFAGIYISQSKTPERRRIFLMLSILVNLSALGFFKYYNFFAENFAHMFTLFGKPFNASTLRIILPVGISFYTFQSMSYTIDIYRNKLTPTHNPIEFFAFISFFPQLVAGPIERATNLLPQFTKKREFNYTLAVDGLRQILWGLFKKMVIADSCAAIVNEIFMNNLEHSGSELFIGVVLFAFQIYGDFSGYSDIAIGTAKLFGFRLMRNFAYPYFSRDIAEFWRRWHISLSTWFRDYLYIPLGGSRVSKSKQIRNTFVIFIVSGFWHGANWTFIFWGMLNAIYFLPLLLTKQNRKNIDTINPGKLLPSLKESFQILTTFFLTTFAWIFFRAQNLQHAMQYIKGIFTQGLIKVPSVNITLIIIIIVFVFIEWIQRNKEHALQFHSYLRLPIRWAIYMVLVVFILNNSGASQEFIYFQF